MDFNPKEIISRTSEKPLSKCHFVFFSSYKIESFSIKTFFYLSTGFFSPSQGIFLHGINAG